MNQVAVLLMCVLSFHLALGQAFLQKKMDTEAKLPEVLDLGKVKTPKGLSSLSLLKWYQLNGEWEKCVLQANKTNLALAQPWVSYLKITCLKTLYSKRKGSSSFWIKTFLDLENEKQQLLLSAFSIHREKLLRVFLDLLEISFESSRSQFDTLVEKNQDLVEVMDKAYRSEYYRWVGEMAALRQQTDVAAANFMRSYGFQETAVVKNRLKQFKVQTLLKVDKYDSNLLPSSEETKSWEQFSKASQRGEVTRMGEFGVNHLINFPGSNYNASIQSQISRQYKRLLARRGDQYIAAKNDFEKMLKKAPAQWLLMWANDAYQRGYQESTFQLAEVAAEKWQGDKRASEALLLAARAAFFSNRRSDAEKYLKVLTDAHSGSEAQGEAFYWLGLLYYRQEAYDKVVNLYERYLQSQQSDKWELQVRYWLYRSLKKINSKRSNAIAESILKNFPLTYYGLIVRMEEKKELDSLFRKDQKKYESVYFWSAPIEERWKRIQLFMESGLLQEAESEMDQLPDPALPEQLVIRARWWTHMGLHNRALQDYNAAVDRDPELINPSLTLEYFPNRYKAEVDAAAKEFTISSSLIWAIMRQESAFMERAQSPSNAFGLMQLLGPTARETARILKMGALNVPEGVYNTRNNIRFGSHFIARMMRKYQGVAPLAIASYNVGPGNLDRWLSFRSDLKNWKDIGSSPDDDIWMDELPWAETSFYVKAVMRNFLLYQLIHEKQSTLEQPPWRKARPI